MRKAIVIGGSGLVGKELLALLCEDPNYVSVQYFGRSNVEKNHEKLDFIQTDFSDFNDIKDKINGDVLFSTLGTTIKKAGSKDAQKKVDYDFQLEFATVAAQKNVESYVLISSVGAHPNSRIYYSTLKGQLEQAIKKLDFKYKHILRPSLLSGKRKEGRWGEEFGIKLSGLLQFIPFFKKYRAIPAKTVAKAMLACVEKTDKISFEIIEADHLFKLADKYRK